MNKDHFLQKIGPGIVVVATGVGAGDMIAASVAGAKYGTIILWAAVVDAVVKFFLNAIVAMNKRQATIKIGAAFF